MFWGRLVISSETDNGLWAVVGVTYISSELSCHKPESSDWVLNSIFASQVSIKCLSLHQQVLTLNQKIIKYLLQSSALPVSWRSNTLIWRKGLCKVGTANAAHGKWAVLKMRGKIDGVVRSWATWLLPLVLLGGHLRPQLLQEALQGRGLGQHWGYSISVSLLLRWVFLNVPLNGHTVK